MTSPYNNMPTSDELKNKIVSELRLGDMPSKEQDEVTELIAQNLLGRVMLALLEHLPNDEAREKFSSLAEAGDSTALKEFARAQIKDFDTLISSEIEKELSEHKAELGKS